MQEIFLLRILLRRVTLITACIRRIRKVIFSVCSHLQGGGYPVPGLWVRGYPIPGLGRGYPPARSGRWGGGVPWVPPTTRTGWGTHPPSRQSSIASTCYAAGGMPLAFTQEDFLVLNVGTHNEAPDQVSSNNRFEYTVAPSHNGSDEVRDAWTMAHSARNYTVPVQLGGRFLGEGPDSFKGPDCSQR